MGKQKHNVQKPSDNTIAVWETREEIQYNFYLYSLLLTMEILRE